MYTCEELHLLQERLLRQRHPPPTKPHYYLRDEVCIHNKRHDAWVIVNDRVLDLMPFFAKPDILPNPPLEELLTLAGKDISYHFTADNQPRTRISVHGTILPTLAATIEHTVYTGGKQPVPTNAHPDEDDLQTRIYWWQTGTPWEIGRITQAERIVRIINTMTMSRISMTVCEEDTLDDIRAKYNARYNSHSGSYTWRKSGRNRRAVDLTGSLDFAKTLTENGILKESHTSVAPAIWLYYTDDFTVA